MKRWWKQHFVYIFLLGVFAAGVLTGTTVAYMVQATASAADDSLLEEISQTEIEYPTIVPSDALVAAEQWEPPDKDVEILAKLIYGEARGISSTTEKAAVVWCVLNRVDSPSYPDTLEGVVTQRHQFAGYKADNPVTEDFSEIARDVLERWHSEKTGAADVGRVLPDDYIYFTGDGNRNYFTAEWSSSAVEYDWALPSPYEN